MDTAQASKKSFGTPLAWSLIVLSWTHAAIGQTAPPPGDPTPRPQARRAAAAPEVRFEADEGDVSLLIARGVEPVAYGYYRHGWWGYRRAFVRSYAPICTGACIARFLPGEYDFALEKDGRVVPAPRVVITRPSVLRAHYTDRSGLRVAGVVIAIGGIIGGSIMMFDAARRPYVCDAPGYCYYHSTVDGPLFAGGLGVLVGGVIAGTILAWQGDEANVTVLPFTLSSLVPREGVSFATRALPDGAAVNVRF